MMAPIMDQRDAPVQMPNPSPRLLSVGHSNHPPDFFLHLLRQASVAAIVDVRSSPYSRRLPQYNRPQLEAMLNQAGIAYVFLGELLGGRPRDLEVYDSAGRVDYERVRATDSFREGLQELVKVAEEGVPALLCSEEDPLDCHRGLMIAPALAERGIEPFHLRKNGRLESTAEMEERLLMETRIGEAERGGLFPLSEEDRRDLLVEAYRIMARRKAFQIQLRVDEP
jgi:uncharacterized protein (DUF488 family)